MHWMPFWQVCGEDFLKLVRIPLPAAGCTLHVRLGVFAGMQTLLGLLYPAGGMSHGDLSQQAHEISPLLLHEVRHIDKTGHPCIKI